MAISRSGRSGISISTAPKKSRSLIDTSGLPSSPFNLSGTVVGPDQINLTWTAPTISGDSAITSYTVTLSPAHGSASFSGTSASVTGLTASTAYTIFVSANNSLGTGTPSDSITSTTTAYNAATGGSETTVTNYNGTGQTWKVHQFTSSGTLNVTANAAPFRVAVINNGNGGGPVNSGGPSGGGGPGGTSREYTNSSLSLGNVSITIGGTSSVGSITSAGGTSGAGGGGASHQGGPGASGGQPGPAFAITGSSTNYAGGGGGGGLNSSGAGGGNGGGGQGYLNGSPGTNGLGGGGGGQGYWQPDNTFYGPGGGGSGRCIVAYRIG